MVPAEVTGESGFSDEHTFGLNTPQQSTDSL